MNLIEKAYIALCVVLFGPFALIAAIMSWRLLFQTLGS